MLLSRRIMSLLEGTQIQDSSLGWCRETGSHEGMCRGQVNS